MPPVKLKRPKRRAEIKNAVFSLAVEFCAQMNKRVKIGASNDQSQNELNRIKRRMTIAFDKRLFTFSTVSKMKKHNVNVAIMLKP